VTSNWKAKVAAQSSWSDFLLGPRTGSSTPEKEPALHCVDRRSHSAEALQLRRPFYVGLLLLHQKHSAMPGGIGLDRWRGWEDGRAGEVVSSFLHQKPGLWLPCLANLIPSRRPLFCFCTCVSTESHRPLLYVICFAHTYQMMPCASLVRVPESVAPESRVRSQPWLGAWARSVSSGRVWFFLWKKMAHKLRTFDH